MTRRVTLGAFAPALLLLAGCLHSPRPAAPPAGDALDLLRALPGPVKGRVHVLLVHGHGLHEHSWLAGLRLELIEAGLIKAYAGGSLKASALADMAHDSFLREPDARFVVAGTGNVGPSLAARLQAKGVPVTRVVSLDGDRAAARVVLLRELHEEAQRVAVVEEGRGPPPPVAGEWDFLRCTAPDARRCLPFIQAREMSPGE